MDEAKVEYAGAKDLIAQIEAMKVGDDLYDAEVKVLGEQIDHHVEEEETERFPEVRGAYLDLKALGARMAARKAELSAAWRADGGGPVTRHSREPGHGRPPDHPALLRRGGRRRPT